MQSLPLLAATILASKGKTVLQNVPILSDATHESSGSRSECQGGLEAMLSRLMTGGYNGEAPYVYVSKMRASIVVLTNPARVGWRQSFYARRVQLLSRPIDLHLKGT